MKNFICLLTVSLVLIAQSLNAQWVRCDVPNNIFFSFAATTNNGGEGTNLFAGSNNYGVYLSTDNGITWTPVNQGATFGQVRALAVMDTSLFAAAGAVFRSDNHGSSWTSTDLKNFEAQALAVSDTNVFAGTFVLGTYRSSDKGNSWTAVNSGLTDSALYVTTLFTSGKNLFAGTWGGGALRSTDNGTSWTAINNGLAHYVHTFAESPAGVGDTLLFAGTYFGQGVYLSTDNGNSWTAVNSGLTNKNIRTLAVSPNGKGGFHLFAGTDGGGVFVSENNGDTWKESNDSLTGTVVNGLFVSGSYLFAGTNNGVWRRPLSDLMTDVKQISADNTPNGIHLEQNYPNPFNRSTKISYQISTPENVTLIVYDTLGKVVSTLVNEKMQAGRYEVNFGARDLPGGIYFYTLRAGNSIEIKKMILSE